MSMTSHIVHKGKKYEIKEPTIQSWSELMKFKDLIDDNEMYVKMISHVTDIPEDEIKKTDAKTINQIGYQINKYINREVKELYRNIEHKGIKYVLTDFKKISFGQFVDIDTFLQKDDSYRLNNLNELASYLYIEEGTNYSDSDFTKRIDQFRDLPIKYVEGSLFFLWNLGRGLQEVSSLYSKSKLMFQIMRLRIVLGNIGDGINRSLFYQKTVSQKLIGLLLFPLYLVLIILVTLWISIRRKKE